MSGVLAVCCAPSRGELLPLLAFVGMEMMHCSALGAVGPKDRRHTVRGSWRGGGGGGGGAVMSGMHRRPNHCTPVPRLLTDCCTAASCLLSLLGLVGMQELRCTDVRGESQGQAAHGRGFRQGG
jgi:hypothetical protein